MVMVCTASWAGRWTDPGSSAYSGSTNIYFDLKLNGSLAGSGSVEVGAFINNQVRGDVYANTLTSNGITYGVLRVRGNQADNGKTITLKVSVGANVYELTETFTYTGGSIGTLSNLKHFSVVDPFASGATITVPSITVGVGETVNVLDCVRITLTDGTVYTGNTLPLPCPALSNVNNWKFGTTSSVSRSGFVLTGVKGTGPQGEDYRLSVSGLAGSILTLWSTLYVTPFNYFTEAGTTVTVDDITLNMNGVKTADLRDLVHISHHVVGRDDISGTWRQLETQGVLPAGFSATINGTTLVSYSNATHLLTAGRTSTPEGESMTVTLNFGEFTASASSTVRVTPYNILLTGINLDNSVTQFPRFETGYIGLTIEPSNASFDPANLVIEAVCANNMLWDAGDVRFVTHEGHPAIEFTPSICGHATLRVQYEAIESTLELDCSFDQKVVDGWSWNTYPWIDGTETLANIDNNIYGGKLLDVRSQDADNLKDPVYGFFGDLTSLDANSCYKMQTSGLSGNSVKHVYGIEALPIMDMMQTIDLRQGWNWVCYPYAYDRSFEDLKVNFMGAMEGDRIISLDGGFAEYDGMGSWMSSLTEMKHGEGYLFYCSSPYSLMWDSESSMPQPVVNSTRRMAREVVRTWNYNAHNFRDNMTIVAEVEGLRAEAGTTIGVFVNGECRGEGTLVENGDRQYFFITAHGEDGETLDFMINDGGSNFPVIGNLAFTAQAGSLRHPVVLASPELTGIAVTRQTTEANNAMFDLQGRRLSSSPLRGIVLKGGEKVLR